MRIKYVLAGAAILALGACAGDPEDPVKAGCLTIVQAPEFSNEIAELGLTAASYCDCMLASFSALPEEDNTRLRGAIVSMATAMRGTGGSAERAFAMLGDVAEAEDATPDAIKLYEDVREFSRTFRDFNDDLGRSGGTCPVSQD